MRIVHWTESFWPRIGGAENFVRLLARDAVSRGHECVVVTDCADGLDSHGAVDGVPIRRFPFQSTLARRDIREVTSLARQVIAFVRGLMPSLVHLHTSQPGAFFFLRTQKALAMPAIFTTHDPLEPAEAGPLLTELLGVVQRIAGISSFMTEAVASLFPKHAKRVQCIPNGLPWPDLQASPLPWNPRAILAAGRLAHSKGFDVLLRALPIVRGDLTDVTLTVAGDGPCRNELQALARGLGIEAHVRFPGWISPHDMASSIDRATVLAIPSRWQEPFGLVALEAMQLARPVIASRVGGLPELVKTRQTGELVPADNPLALADALRIVLSDRDAATTWGKNGQELARSAFDWKRCADSYNKLYREVAG